MLAVAPRVDEALIALSIVLDVEVGDRDLLEAELCAPVLDLVLRVRRLHAGDLSTSSRKSGQ